MLQFTVEEITVINNYNCTDRMACIDVLIQTLPFYKQPGFADVGEIIESTLHKLNHITDDQYHGIDLSLALEIE